jgi:hypothetical protein
MIRKRFLQNAQKLTGLTNDVPAYPALEPGRRDWFQKGQRESCSQYESRNHLMTSAFFRDLDDSMYILDFIPPSSA